MLKLSDIRVFNFSIHLESGPITHLEVVFSNETEVSVDWGLAPFQEGGPLKGFEIRLFSPRLQAEKLIMVKDSAATFAILDLISLGEAEGK